MGFAYGINSLKFIKSVQLTASFQQVRFSSIKFQVQKKIWHVYNAMSVLFLYLLQISFSSKCLSLKIQSVFIHLLLLFSGKSFCQLCWEWRSNFEYTFYTIIWLTQSARETWSFSKDLILGRLTQSVSRELFLYYLVDSVNKRDSVFR